MWCLSIALVQELVPEIHEFQEVVPETHEVQENVSGCGFLVCN